MRANGGIPGHAVGYTGKGYRQYFLYEVVRLVDLRYLVVEEVGPTSWWRR